MRLFCLVLCVTFLIGKSDTHHPQPTCNFNYRVNSEIVNLDTIFCHQILTLNPINLPGLEIRRIPEEKFINNARGCMPAHRHWKMLLPTAGMLKTKWARVCGGLRHRLGPNHLLSQWLSWAFATWIKKQKWIKCTNSNMNTFHFISWKPET